jgi:hypothetical protein
MPFDHVFQFEPRRAHLDAQPLGFRTPNHGIAFIIKEGGQGISK